MSKFSEEMTVAELLQVAADHHNKSIELTEAEKTELIGLLKRRGQEELDYGEEMACGTVRLIKRVTGAIGVYFS